MFWLDLAIAARNEAEQAFFESDGDAVEDDIPRLRLEPFSEFELAHLGMLLCDGFDPQLVLDGDAPDEVITACDAHLVAALARLTEDQLPPLAQRWQVSSGVEQAEPLLVRLQALAQQAQALGKLLLYAQGDDRPGSPA